MRSLSCLMLLLLMVPFVGCAPYHEAVLVEIGTSEEGFLIELSGENKQAKMDEATLKEKLIQTKRIEIPHEFKSTGRMWWSGKWIPTARLVKVDRAPCNRTWVADTDKGTSNKDEGIWLESSDSVSFSTGVVITARIESTDDAIKFLSNYPPESQGGADPDATYEVKVSSLKNIMDEEIQNKVQEILSIEAAGYAMDELRDKKKEMIEATKTAVVPFFEERGITITTLGMTGGLTYSNPKIQTAIDEVFQAQQDKQVAIAEAAAAEERKVALKSQGEGKAAEELEVAKGKAQAEIEVATAKAKGIEAVADAKAYEISKLAENPEAYMALKTLEIEEKRLETWDGKYPLYMLTGAGQQMPNLFMNMPNIDTSNMKLKPTSAATGDGSSGGAPLAGGESSGGAIVSSN